MWIHGSVVAISPFWVDVITSGKGVGLGSQASRAEANDKVELGEVFRPSGLAARQ